MARYYGVPLRNGLPIGLGSAISLRKPGGAAAAVPDPYFEYTTLLLPGNGTNGAQNNTFLDSSANAFLITRNGNTTQGSFSPFSQTGWSNYFDGTGDYLSVGSNASLNASNGDFTIECWVYTTARNTNSCTLFSLRNSDDASFADPGINNDGKLQCWNSSGAFGSASTGSVPLNQWTHVAFVRSSNVLYYYINGTQNGSTAMTNTWSGTTPKIGGQNWNAAFMYNGYISNIRYTKSAVYTSSFTPSTTPLTAITNTQLLTCQSNRFIDNSTNAFAITRNGDVSVQPFSPFNPTTPYSTSAVGGSGYFDGSGDYLSVANNTALNFGSSNFTVEFWIKTTQTTDYATLICKEWGGAFPGGWNIFLNGASSSAMQIWWSDFSVGAPFMTASTTAYRDDAWHHVAWVRNGTSFVLYLDGVSVATATSSTAFGTNTNALSIGNDVTYGPRFYNGYMSGLRIVKGTAVYTSAFTPPTAPLTAITNTSLLLNYTNGAIFDATAKNDLETVGNAQISTTQSKFGGSSIAIIGSSSNRVKPPASQNFAFGTGDFTVEAWIYITDLTTENFVFDTRSSVSTSGMGFSIEPNTGKLRYSGNANNVLTSSAVSANTWTHVAWCRYGGTLRGFINGILGGTAANTDNLTQTNGEVGNVPFSNVTTNMYLDDIRVTKGIARYTANFTPPDSAFPLL